MYYLTMQNPQITRLGKRIRKVREHRYSNGKNTPWRLVCVLVRPQILKPDGTPDTGMAFKLAYKKDYEPEREVQVRLGLHEFCTSCHRNFRKPSTKAKVEKTPARIWWESLSKDEQEAILFRLHKLEGLM